MIISDIFNRRFRGFRVIDLVALTVLLVLALASYAFKTFAEGMGANTADVETQIAQEDRRIRLLKAEIAHLDDPGRIERLSSQYLSLQAADPKQETTAEALPQVALKPITPAPPKPAAPSASTASPATPDATSKTKPEAPAKSAPPASPDPTVPAASKADDT
ncbi:MAG TPA: cell division protein [Caulobacteraceae bacterium]